MTAGAPCQLTLTGDEVPHPPPRPTALTPAQREILRALAGGEITSSDAGAIVHAHRDPPAGEERHHYRSSDGRDALTRLARRGLVRRVARGRWELIR
jgi:hypothetical protein